MRWLLPCLLVIGACERNATITRVVREDHALADGDFVDIGIGPPIERKCPLRGLWFDHPQHGVLLDECGGAFVTYDGGQSFVVVDRARSDDPETYLTEMGFDGVYYEIEHDAFFVLRFGEPRAERPLRRTGGGVFERIREQRRITDARVCGDDQPCVIGRTDHALVVSTDAGASFRVVARTALGRIDRLEIVDHEWRALVDGEVLRVVAGELVGSKQRAVDRYDFLRDTSSPAPHPLACLLGAEHGSITVSAREKGCFGGRAFAVTMRWFANTTEIETAATKRPATLAERSEWLANLVEIVGRAEGAGPVSTTRTSAGLTWECDGKEQTAKFWSAGFADTDEEAKTRRACALFRFARSK